MACQACASFSQLRFALCRPLSLGSATTTWHVDPLSLVNTGHILPCLSDATTSQMPLVLTPVFLLEAPTPASTLDSMNAHAPWAHPCLLYILLAPITTGTIDARTLAVQQGKWGSSRILLVSRRPQGPTLFPYHR